MKTKCTTHSPCDFKNNGHTEYGEIIEKLAMLITHSEQGEYEKNEIIVKNLISIIIKQEREKWQKKKELITINK